MTRPRTATMWRFLATVLVLLGCIQRSHGARRERRKLQWRDSLTKSNSRRRIDVDEGWFVVSTHNNGKGKGKGYSNSEDVGYFPFPTIAPQNDTTIASGVTGPPVVTPSITPIASPTTALTVTPPTKKPTPEPTALPTTAEQKAACDAVSNSDVYMTETYITVRFLYELLTPANRNMTEVASSVDEKVQDFLVEELVDCKREHMSIGGVGPGEVDTVVDDVCSTLAPTDSQTCHVMEGTVVLFFLSNSLKMTDREGFEKVSEKLKGAFNGERRSLQSSFVNEELGILGLYFIGARVDEEKDDSTKTEDATSIVSGSGQRSSSAVVPAVVVPVVLIATVAVFVAGVLIRRRRRSFDPSRGLLLGDDESTLGEERWEEVQKVKEPLKFKVLESTDNSESGSSGGAAVAAHEVVMADLTGMTVSDSLSDWSPVKPVFIDPDSVTYYTRSPSRGSRRYYKRDYVVDDTVDI